MIKILRHSLRFHLHASPAKDEVWPGEKGRTTPLSFVGHKRETFGLLGVAVGTDVDIGTNQAVYEPIALG